MRESGDAETSASPSKRHLSKALEKDIRRLQVSTTLREDIVKILTHRECPLWMSVAGRTVRNPVWKGVSEDAIREMAERYAPSGTHPPTIKHLDLLLIRRNDAHGHGRLYTYLSNDWGTYLLTFRERLPDEKRDDRRKISASKIARHWSVKAESIEVTPLLGKYAISVKPHEKYRDLYLYVFEFCSVVFRDSSASPLRSQVNDSPESRPSHKWLPLSAMRKDTKSESVNGDVIRALHDVFTYDLGPLPVSLQ